MEAGTHAAPHYADQEPQLSGRKGIDMSDLVPPTSEGSDAKYSAHYDAEKKSDSEENHGEDAIGLTMADLLMSSLPDEESPDAEGEDTADNADSGREPTIGEEKHQEASTTSAERGVVSDSQATDAHVEESKVPAKLQQSSSGSSESKVAPFTDADVPIDVPYFGPMVACPVTYYVANACSHSVQTTTIVSTRPFHDKGPVLRKKKSKRALNPYAPAKETVIPVAGSPAQNRALVKERDEFLRNLRSEREAAEAGKEKAAAIIQMAFREYRKRSDRHEIRQAALERRRALKESMWYSPDDIAALLEALQESTEQALEEKKLQPFKEEAADYLQELKKTTRLKEKARSSKKLERARRLAAVVSIQRAIRGFLARRALDIMFRLYLHEEGLNALTRVQASFKGHFLRKRAYQMDQQRQEQAVRVIQALARSFLARCRINVLRAHVQTMLRRNEAARSIQSMYRGYVARKLVSELYSTRLATKLQAVYRGHRTRRAGKEAKEAAQRIEGLMLVRKAKEEAATRRALLQQKLAIEEAFAHKRRENQGASALQAVWRGRRDRKRVEGLRMERREAAAVRAQALYRGHLARRHVGSQLQERKEASASVVIQSAARRRLAKAEMDRRRQAKRAEVEAEATLRMQSIIRGGLARKEARAKRQFHAETAAAVEVQRLVRGRLTRLRVEAERARRLAEAAAAAEAAPGRRRRRRRLRGQGSSRDVNEEQSEQGSARDSVAEKTGGGGGGGSDAAASAAASGEGDGSGKAKRSMLPPVPRPEQRITGTKQGGVSARKSDAGTGDGEQPPAQEGKEASTE